MFKLPRFSPIYYWIIAFIGCAVIATFIRLYPLRAHLSTEAHEKASLYVVYKIQDNFFKQIHASNPTLSPLEVQQLAQQQLNTFMHKEPKKVITAIDAMSEQIAKESKTPLPIYLLESDPYYYYNLTEHIEQTGKISPLIKGSKYLNTLMNAPDGDWQPFTLHPYIGYWLYQGLHGINSSITLMTATAYLSLIISILTIFIFAGICWHLRLGLSASITSCFILTLAPIYLKRSSLGWYDTDPYNILFTLILTALILFALRSTKRIETIIYGSLYGVCLSVFALIWQGWVMMFLLGFGCIISVVTYSFIIKKFKDTYTHAITFLITSCITSTLIISLCFGFNDFLILFKEGFGELAKFTVKNLDIWPNLFIAVGELKKSTFVDFVKSIGGLWIAAIGLISCVWLIRQHIFRFKQSTTYSIVIIGSLLFATLFLSMSAERFILFCLIPLALVIGFAIHEISKPIYRRSIAIILILITTFWANTNISTIVTPIFNPTWEKALTDLNHQTPQNSIINTWWPPGHFVKAISKRAVIFDGATLDEGAIGYWFARALLENNEKKAQGILQMINTSRNKAVAYLTTQGLSTSEAIALIEQIIPLNNSELAATLQHHLHQDQVNTLIKLLRGTPNSYLLLYNEIMEESLILSFTGNWNIGKVEAINKNPELLARVPKRGSKEFIEFCWAMAGGQPKSSPPINLISSSVDLLQFNDGLSINPQTMLASMNSPTYGQGAPYSVIYLNQGKIIEQINPHATLHYSVVLYLEDNKAQARLMDTFLANSLLVKLYIFGGEGLKYFKPMGNYTDLSHRTTIKTFQINYNE